eukprot:TRINITY_DN5763_c0_g1_i1.p1 TRINITY_DN5763_c0_g1~~TRINITY_DN5763_c0_g1_i1.p1  ORF type:complete len:190 (-),score=44.50 TRINITY_DN5763_c0_g1_i1:10-579(-)
MDNNEQTQQHTTPNKNAPKKKPSEAINVDSSLIRSAPLSSTFEGSALNNLSSLGVQLFNPDDLDRGVMKQVEEAIAKKQQNEFLVKLRKVRDEMGSLQDYLTKVLEPQLTMPKLATQKDRERNDQLKLEKGIKTRRLNELKQQEKSLLSEITKITLEIEDIEAKNEEEGEKRNTIVGEWIWGRKRRENV